MKKRIISLLPVMIVMGLIFWFSAAPAVESAELSFSWSVRLVTWIEKIYHRDINYAYLLSLAESIEAPLRKCAHFLEYTGLGITVMIHLYTLWWDQIYIKKRFALLFCFLYAISDEIHQYFVPGRACLAKDVMIDTAGAFTGIMVTYFVLHIIFRHLTINPIERKM